MADEGRLGDYTPLRWLIILVFVAAICFLIGYARGDDSDNGRSPELGDALPALTVDGPAD